jgi:hypothetical protein
MDEVNIIFLCSGFVVALIIGVGWRVSNDVSYETCCNMRGYTPVNTVEDI